jgi:hypothetical protein
MWTPNHFVALLDVCHDADDGDEKEMDVDWTEIGIKIESEFLTPQGIMDMLKSETAERPLDRIPARKKKVHCQYIAGIPPVRQMRPSKC